MAVAKAKTRAKLKVEDFVNEPEHLKEIEKLEEIIKNQKNEIQKLEEIIEHQEVVIMVDLLGENEDLKKEVKGLKSDVQFLLNRFRVKEDVGTKVGKIVSIPKRMCA